MAAQVNMLTLFILITFLLLTTTLFAKKEGSSASSIPQSDIDAMQVALNLEFLQAELFCFSALGRGIDQIEPSLSGGGPPATGTRQANVDGLVKDITIQFCYQEVDHIMGIRATVGGFPRPLMNLDRDVFAQMMDLAFENNLYPPFDIYGSNLKFLLAASLFPYITSTAYNGASSIFKSPAAKRLAMGLETIEAGRDGMIRFLLYLNRYVYVWPYDIQVLEFVRRISLLRDSLGGNGIRDEGIMAPIWQGAHKSTTANVLAGDNYSTGYGRTAAEIFRIVYTTASEFQPGGFFTNGCNGNTAREFIAHAP